MKLVNACAMLAAAVSMGLYEAAPAGADESRREHHGDLPEWRPPGRSGTRGDVHRRGQREAALRPQRGAHLRVGRGVLQPLRADGVAYPSRRADPGGHLG